MLITPAQHIFQKLLELISLVTGGAGFIGSHLVDSLLIKGHRVRVIDNFASGHRDNLRHHLTNSQLEIFEHDVSDPAGLTEIF